MKAALHDKVYNGYYKQTKKTDKKYKDNEKKKKVKFVSYNKVHIIRKLTEKEEQIRGCPDCNESIF